MVNELRISKKQYRETYYEQLDNDKIMIEKHEALVKQDMKVRKM